MAKGREAASSAEKSRGGIQKEIDTFRNTPKNYSDYFKGISVPEVPSDKAMELMKKGKPVSFT
jgi:hypothetical protein